MLVPAADQLTRTKRRCAVSLHTRRHTRQPLWVAFVRTWASSVPSCPARAHEWCRVHETVRLRAAIISFRAPRDCSAFPVLESSTTDIDRRISPTVMQTCANVPSEECEDAFHQREETQQLFACPVSIETVPNKIWNQKGSLNIATLAEYTRTLCTQTRCSTRRVRPACEVVVCEAVVYPLASMEEKVEDA